MALIAFRELEAGSDDERELRGVWLSRLMFGSLATPELALRYVEERSYEEWLTAAGYRLV